MHDSATSKKPSVPFSSLQLPEKSGRTYLITGGTGSLGSALTLHLLSQGHKVRVYARNEHGHERLERLVPEIQRCNLSPIVGAVEDASRLRLALRGCTHVVHAAAQKVIPLCEYNPVECVRTNIDGTANVARASLDEDSVERAVFISSDKASASINLYGHTKAVGEKIWLQANRYCGADRQKFVAVRYGNCWNSRGSVIQSFQLQAQYGFLTLTSGECTRFHWKLDDAVRFVLAVLDNASPSEMWIPRLPSYKLEDLAYAFMEVAKLTKKPVISGLRLGEKLHETMLCADESFMAREAEEAYILTPGQVQAKGGWSIHSGANTWRIGRRELVQLIEETIYAKA